MRKNTYKKGFLTFLSYKTDNNTYIVACEELCLLVEDKDQEYAKLKIMKNAKSYLENVISNKLGENLLNQSLPDQIESEFFEMIRKHSDNFERYRKPVKEILESNLCLV